MSRTYRSVGFEFLDEARVSETLRQSLPVSADKAFATLEDADAWPVWLVPVDKVVWTTPKPFGIGTTRDIYNKAGVTSEYFFAWEDGRRMSFHFSEGKLPLDAFAEDYVVEPTGPDSCELTWRYAFQAAGPARLFEKPFNAVFKRQAIQSLKNLATHLQ